MCNILSFIYKDFFIELIKNIDKIYVYTTKGEIIELPKDSTAIDFAYKIHPDIGNTMVSALVNDEIVYPEHVLHNKDRVEIITNLMSYGPREEWINNVQITRAKRIIREFKNLKNK